MAQLPLPVGAAPPDGPVTVAVIVIVEPRVGLALADREIEGVAWETVMMFDGVDETDEV